MSLVEFVSFLLEGWEDFGFDSELIALVQGSLLFIIPTLLIAGVCSAFTLLLQYLFGGR